MSKNKSKTKTFLKKLFPYNSNRSKKSKLSNDDSETKTIVQSTGNRFLITPQSLEDKEITHISSSICHENSNENDVVCSDIYNMEPLNLSIVSTDETVQKSPEPIITNPLNFTELSLIENNVLTLENTVVHEVDLLTIPTASHNRKSRDSDSAVNNSSDQTHSNDSDISKCTSSALMLINDSNVKSIKDLKIEEKPTTIKRNDSSSSWGKIRAALLWIPFIQQHSKNRYPWIQIAGHQGNFKPGEEGTVLKKHCGRESICLQMMTDSNLADFVPDFKGDVFFEDEKYICMQDLLAQFHMPSLMDIKMGTRTYLEEEISKAKCCPKPRQDMYEKMIAVDRDEPTEEEHRLRAVIKPRYMQWRESLSSSLLLGFRIEGIKKSVGTQSRNYKRTRDRLEVKESLLDFIDNDADLPKQFIQRLQNLRRNLEDSTFFWDHEFIGSSLLFVHDNSGKSNIWMIDFGKTIPLPPKFKIDHISSWIEGNHEDGYLLGLENLLILLQEIYSEISNNPH